MWKLNIPWPRSKAAQNRIENSWALSMSLLDLSRADKLTLGQAVEGILILCATGSGKSSGSGKSIGMSFLRAGFGGLILCVKTDERQIWEERCREAGRSDDLLIFGADQPWRFNFIDYELNRKGKGAGLTENLVKEFSTVLEIAQRNSDPGGGREDGGYWRLTNRQLSRNIIDLLIWAGGHLSIPDMYRVLVSAPESREEFKSKEWQAESFCFKCLCDADKKPKTPRERKDFGIVSDYWCLEYPKLSSKTRSIIVSSFTSMIDVLNRNLLGELFCTTTNVTPEAAESGKIIIVDLPVLEFSEVGQFANILWKFNFQRAMLRRDITANPRPVFLWQDEGHYFTTGEDPLFQSTCRAFRVANVVLSQNVSNFYATLGEGEKGKALCDSLFGNLNLKIFHANSDPVTNEWASTIIGKTRQFMMNASNSYQPADWFLSLPNMEMPQASSGISEQWDFEVPQSTFTQLRTGGPANNWEVDAIIFFNGLCFNATGRPWTKAIFKQK